MGTFNKWWQAEEEKMRQQGADDDAVLDAMRSIAEMAWDAAIDAAVQVLERRVEIADGAIASRARIIDEDTMLSLRSTSLVVGGLADHIKGMKND